MTAASSKLDASAPTGDESDETRFQRTARAVLNSRSQSDGGEVQLRLASTDDLSALRVLNDNAIMDLGRDGLFMPMPESFLTAMVRDGIILVPDRDGKPLGYSIAVPSGHHQPAFIPEAQPGGTGLLFGTALDPALRGQGWHPKLIAIRQRMFRDAGFSSVQATASPFNTVSLANLINSGFHVSGLKTLLDGHPRFLLRHELRRQRKPTEALRSVVLPQTGDLSEHEALLADGFIATGLRKGQPCTLLYTEGTDGHSGGPDR